jgi:recombination protein RecA
MTTTKDPKDPRQMAVTSALEAIQKQFGKGSIMRLGDAPVEAIEVIPTGIMPLDSALGVGGIPKGRIVEIYGPEASGKTTVCLSIIAEMQKNRRRCRLYRC